MRENDTLFSVDLRQPGSPIVAEGAHPDAFYTWRTDGETLAKLCSGDIGPGTASAMENITDDAPLKALLPDGESWTMEHYHTMVEFETAFFNPFNPEMVRFGEKYTRSVHGGHAVGLFNGKGMRCAWYSIHKGERVNDERHANPFPQGIIILSGQMKSVRDGKEQLYSAGEAYLIPAGTPHTSWNEGDEPVHAIWIAWGIGA